MTDEVYEISISGESRVSSHHYLDFNRTQLGIETGDYNRFVYAELNLEERSGEQNK